MFSSTEHRLGETLSNLRHEPKRDPTVKRFLHLTGDVTGHVQADQTTDDDTEGVGPQGGVLDLGEALDHHPGEGAQEGSETVTEGVAQTRASQLAFRQEGVQRGHPEEQTTVVNDTEHDVGHHTGKNRQHRREGIHAQEGQYAGGVAHAVGDRTEYQNENQANG